MNKREKGDKMKVRVESVGSQSDGGGGGEAPFPGRLVYETSV